MNELVEPLNMTYKYGNLFGYYPAIVLYNRIDGPKPFTYNDRIWILEVSEVIPLLTAPIDKVSGL